MANYSQFLSHTRVSAVRTKQNKLYGLQFCHV